MNYLIDVQKRTLEEALSEMWIDPELPATSVEKYRI
jgi:hypothetical protein